MLEQFEKTTKLTFRNPSEKSTIKFGSNRDKDPEFDIRSGHLTLEGYVGRMQYLGNRMALKCLIELQLRNSSTHPSKVSSMLCGSS